LLNTGQTEIEGLSQMKRTVVAAALALAGAALAVPSANAAVFAAPGQSVLREQAKTGIIQVQRPSRGAARSVARPARPAFRAARPAGIRPSRATAIRPGVRPGRPAGVRPGGVVRPGFRPGRPIAGRHVRGFRPAGFRRWHPRHLVYRPWHRRPYYGRIIGGVALGTLLAATAYYAYASAPPADGLCWFWADADETQGYWDYCIDP
jgi:hypothetical protein